MSACRSCGRDRELRLGFCFDCASAGEARAAKRTVRQHLVKALVHWRRRDWWKARYDLRWAWERFTMTGDYAKGGYFEEMGDDA